MEFPDRLEFRCFLRSKFGQLKEGDRLELISRDELKTIASFRSDSCVSLFLPTHRAGAEILEDPIRLKNLTAMAEQELVKRGIRAPDARKILEKPRRLLKDGLFWHYQSDGLAIFSAKDFYRVYRLPLNFKEKCLVSDRFYIKPILPALRGNERFFVIAFSQKGVRLLEGSDFGIGEVDTGNLAERFSKILKFSKEERQLQFHSGAAEKTAGGFERVPIFHGHGPGKEDKKDKILRYFSEVDKVLREYLKDSAAPVVLCAVDYLIPIYKKVTDLNRIADRAITGNPDELSIQEIHRRAWEIVSEDFSKPFKRAIDRYRELIGTGHTSTEPKEILPAAHKGLVDTLFVDVDSTVWGFYDERSKELTIHKERLPDSEDLLDICAVESYFHGAKVFALRRDEMPLGTPVAAIFRF